MSPAIASILATAPGAVVLTAQVTCLLLLALALAWLGRRGSSHTLHRLWTMTFGVVLALPLLGVLAPSWDVPILPDADGALYPPAAEAAAVTPVAAATAEGQTSADPPVGAVGGLAVDQPTQFSPTLALLLFVSWALGCAASLASLAFGALRLRALVRAARPLRDPDWLRRIGVMRKQLRIRGPVRLLTSARVLTPMTGGLRKPVILLPASAIDWGSDQRDIVLTHELIHIRRRDALRQVMRRTVLALYWFHPLSWIASRLATLASEKACDDAVLALGIRPSDYARHLLVLARGLSPGPPVLALPIVHPSQLESRIVSVLKHRRPGSSAVRTALILTVIGAAGVLAATARPVPAAAPDHAAPNATAPTAVQEVAPIPAAPAGRAAPESECSPGGPWRLLRDGGDALNVVVWHNWARIFSVGFGDGYLCKRSLGHVVMAADGSAVLSIEPDGRLILESTAGKIHRLLTTQGPDGLEHRWMVDGSVRPFDARAREWRDLMLKILHGYEESSRIRSEDATLRARIAAHRGRIATMRDLIDYYGERVRSGEIEEQDIEDRVARIQAEIEEYGLDEKVARLETAVAALEVERRAREIEDALGDDIARLRRLVNSTS